MVAKITTWSCFVIVVRFVVPAVVSVLCDL